MTDAFPEESKPEWDDVRAALLIGKHVLVGISYCDENEELIEQNQFHGTVIKADANDGFSIEIRGQNEGEIFRLPPDLRAFQVAQPGQYRLRSTGEVVVDPDLLTTWTIKHPSSNCQS